MARGGMFAQRLVRARTVCSVIQQRHFGIDHQLAIARQMQDDVRPRAGGVLARDGLLHGVLVTAAEPRSFEDALQNDFAPVALRLGGALQRLRQILGLGGEPLIHLQQRGHLLGQRAAILALLHVHLIDLRLELLQARLERIEQLPQVGLVLLRKAARLLLQNVVGQHAELVGHKIAPIVQT